jgi:Predicted membrane protein
MFDTPEQIVARAARIRERAVIQKTMPLGNKTNISDAERAILDRWTAQQLGSH